MIRTPLKVDLGSLIQEVKGWKQRAALTAPATPATPAASARGAWGGVRDGGDAEDNGAAYPATSVDSDFGSPVPSSGAAAGARGGGGGSGSAANKPSAGRLMGNFLLQDTPSKVGVVNMEEVALRQQQHVRIQRVFLKQGRYKVGWVCDVDAPACMLCGRDFDRIFRWRHHCRLCGYVVCDACSTSRVTVALLDEGPKGSRACDGCVIRQSLVDGAAATGGMFPAHSPMAAHWSASSPGAVAGRPSVGEGRDSGASTVGRNTEYTCTVRDTLTESYPEIYQPARGAGSGRPSESGGEFLDWDSRYSYAAGVGGVPLQGGGGSVHQYSAHGSPVPGSVKGQRIVGAGAGDNSSSSGGTASVPASAILEAHNSPLRKQESNGAAEIATEDSIRTPVPASMQVQEVSISPNTPYTPMAPYAVPTPLMIRGNGTAVVGAEDAGGTVLASDKVGISSHVLARAMCSASASAVPQSEAEGDDEEPAGAAAAPLSRANSETEQGAALNSSEQNESASLGDANVSSCVGLGSPVPATPGTPLMSPITPMTPGAAGTGPCNDDSEHGTATGGKDFLVHAERIARGAGEAGGVIQRALDDGVWEAEGASEVGDDSTVGGATPKHSLSSLGGPLRQSASGDASYMAPSGLFKSGQKSSVGDMGHGNRSNFKSPAGYDASFTDNSSAGLNDSSTCFSPGNVSALNNTGVSLRSNASAVVDYREPDFSKFGSKRRTRSGHNTGRHSDLTPGSSSVRGNGAGAGGHIDGDKILQTATYEGVWEAEEGDDDEDEMSVQSARR